MIKSMTGFGCSEASEDGLTICIEVKSVNHRYLDLHQRISRGYTFLEEKISAYIKDRLKRGKVDIFVDICDTGADSSNVNIDDALLASYVTALKKVSDSYSLAGNITLDLLSRFNGIFSVDKSKLEEEFVWSKLEPVLEGAINQLIEMRETEGKNIASDLKSKANYILTMISRLEPLCAESIFQYKEKLEKRIKELMENTILDEQRLAMEVAILADKSDISEEIVRLQSHFEQFFVLLELCEPVGRKLDFLLQEMNREINTIGSKSASTDIANIVVDIKAELEKIREQIQNIE